MSVLKGDGILYEILRKILEGFLFGRGEYESLKRNYFAEWQKKDLSYLWPELQELYSSGGDPMAVIIGTIYDEGTTAEVAWAYPFIIKKWMGNKPLTVSNVLEADDKCFLRGGNQGSITSKDVKESTRIIRDDYDGNVERLFFSDSAEVIYNNLKGLRQIGEKKSRMLSRDFVVSINYEGELEPSLWTLPFKKKWKNQGYSRLRDMKKIGLPPDIHAERVVKRLENKKNIDLKQLDQFGLKVYPEFPALLDLLLWPIGRNFCHKTNPRCEDCLLKEICQH